MDFAEKQRRKTLLNTVASSNEAIRAGLPLSPTLMQALFSFVDGKLGTEECDHSSRFTRQFLEANQLPQDKTLDVDANGRRSLRLRSRE